MSPVVFVSHSYQTEIRLDWVPVVHLCGQHLPLYFFILPVLCLFYVANCVKYNRIIWIQLP